MATRHPRYAPIGEYQATNITATTDAHGRAIQALLDTTSTTTISAAGSTTITLAAINSFVSVGSRLAIYSGTGTAEVVQVTAISGSTITANFANTHSGTYKVTLISGTKYGSVIVNTAGTTVTLVLWNGQPDLATSTKIGTPPLTAGNQYVYNGAADQGLFAVYTGTTAGDLTIMALADAV